MSHTFTPYELYKLWIKITILLHIRFTIEIFEIYIILDKNFEVLINHYIIKESKLSHIFKSVPVRETFLDLANGTIIVDLDAWIQITT